MKKIVRALLIFGIFVFGLSGIFIRQKDLKEGRMEKTTMHCEECGVV